MKSYYNSVSIVSCNKQNMASAAEPVLPANEEQLAKLVDDYFRQQNIADRQIADKIENQVVRAIFYVLINLSYALFAIGLLLNIYTAVTNHQAQRLIDFVTSPGRSVFLGVIVLLALAVAAIAKTFSNSQRLTARMKRDYDFVVDVLRGVLYLCIIFFFQPFVFSEPEDRLLIAAFWAMLLAAILYLARKSLKWYEFLIVNKTDLRPWESYTLNSPLLMLNFAKFYQFLQSKQLLALSAAMNNSRNGMSDEIPTGSNIRRTNNKEKDQHEQHTELRT